MVLIKKNPVVVLLLSFGRARVVRGFENGLSIFFGSVCFLIRDGLSSEARKRRVHSPSLVSGLGRVGG